MSYRSILLAVDLHSESSSAMDYALALGEKLGAQVHMLHASPFDAAGHDAAGPTSREDSLEHAKQELEQAVAKHRSSPSLGRCLVSMSEPIRAILNAATKVSADMIIVSTHARRGMDRWIMGSVAQGVLEEAVVPVLVMKAPAAH